MKPQQQLNWKNPFTLWGAILIGLGVSLGGAVGGLCGGGAGAYIMSLANNKKSLSTNIGFALGATIAGIVAYLALVTAVVSFL